jgi:hypothetical protein
LRGLPSTSTNLDGLLQVGFLLVDEIPDEEFVLGLVGKFWTVRAQILKLDAAQYSEFNQRGCTDDHSKSRFKLYWFLIGRFSGLTRREMLRVVKKRVEVR